MHEKKRKGKFIFNDLGRVLLVVKGVSRRPYSEKRKGMEVSMVFIENYINAASILAKRRATIIPARLGELIMSICRVLEPPLSEGVKKKKTARTSI